MRVIDQARLWFREGTSDKVYEVDLVEVATNQYVVNFRFGRRGSALRDGTKTATPVDLAKARSIFGKLVAEKTAGGYQSTAVPTGAATTAATKPPAAPASANDLVARLRQGFRGEEPLGPVVWKVTDRDLVDAEPALLELLDAPKPATYPIVEAAWRHTLVAALARCGTTASLPRLEQLANDARAMPHVRDMARLAITRIAPSRAVELARPFLPPSFASAIAQRDSAALSRAAEELLVTDVPKARAAAIALYLINDATTRPAMFAIVRVIRLAIYLGPEAAIVRTLFRLAELRRDGELYVACARRIDAHTGHTRPFAPRTRAYIRRRVARVLRRLARAGSTDYTAMASALLLAYSDEDAQGPLKSEYNGVWYPPWARYHAFNDILYGRSTRFGRAHHARAAWKCLGDYKPGDPAPAAREETYAVLWDRAPEQLWSLIASGRATPVIEFATKALRPNRAFIAALADEALAAVLASGHVLAQQFAFEMVRNRPMSIVIARGALASDLVDAHAWVLQWIATHPTETAGDPELVALLVTGKTAAMRDAALSVLRGRALPDEIARSVVTRSLAILLGLDATANERAAGAAGTLLRTLEGALRELGTDVLFDLVTHPLAALGELAGEIMLRHAHRDSLPATLLEALLASPHPSVRALGGRLVAMTPPEIAKDDVEALVLFATSANAELREGTRTLIGEVARRFPDVGRALADRLVDALLAPQPIGTPAHIVSLLRSELAACLPHKPPATILRMIGALSPHAREAGGLLLSQLGPDELGLDDIARLAHHEIQTIRQGAWSLARAALPRYRIAPVAVSRLVDSPWEDTRAFAIAFIRDELRTVGADAIIAICDSIRPEVQALGKQLLLEQFQTADAGRYLVRLAEHPSTNLQLLVSGMLEHHLVGDLDRLRALTPYLITVLSQVNRGKVAKERVIALLRREATRAPEAAAVIAPILDRQSATSAISQKHPLIETMVDVRVAFPDIALPIAITPPAPHPRKEGR